MIIHQVCVKKLVLLTVDINNLNSYLFIALRISISSARRYRYFALFDTVCCVFDVLTPSSKGQHEIKVLFSLANSAGMSNLRILFGVFLCMKAAVLLWSFSCLYSAVKLHRRMPPMDHPHCDPAKTLWPENDILRMKRYLLFVFQATLLPPSGLGAPSDERKKGAYYSSLSSQNIKELK